ncbi:hypothetical protein ACTXT7_007509 [Hymenolepis weldensis]
MHSNRSFLDETVSIGIDGHVTRATFGSSINLALTIFSFRSDVDFENKAIFEVFEAIKSPVFCCWSCRPASLVDETYIPDASITKHLKEFEDNKEDKIKTAAKIRQEMESLGLEVFEQNFTFSHKLLRGLGNVSSTNLYAIMRSRSGSRTEALIVIAPLRGSGESEETVSGSYAYLLSLAKQLNCKRSISEILSSLAQLYWAKDIIFLFPAMEYIGLIAWLDAYHGVTTSSIVQGCKLNGRSGSLQAGIVLEFPSLNMARLDLSYQGINGELPNLDLINTIARLARKHSIPLSLHGQLQGFTHSSPLPQIQQLISSIWLQGSGSPSGLHGPLINFQIPCLTLRGIPSARQMPNAQFVRQVGSLIEGFLRCLNNLQERMHQSFYYYLLPDLWHYISIGVYTPFFCVALAGILIQIIRVYMEFTVPEANQSITPEPTVQPSKDCSSIQNDRTEENSIGTEVRRRFKDRTPSKVIDMPDKRSSRNNHLICQIATDIFPALTSLTLCLVGGAVIYEVPELVYSHLIPLSIEHPDTVWKTAEFSVATTFFAIIVGFAFILPVLASITKSIGTSNSFNQFLEQARYTSSDSRDIGTSNNLTTKFNRLDNPTAFTHLSISTCNLQRSHLFC